MRFAKMQIILKKFREIIKNGIKREYILQMVLIFISKLFRERRNLSFSRIYFAEE